MSITLSDQATKKLQKATAIVRDNSQHGQRASHTSVTEAAIEHYLAELERLYPATPNKK